MDANKIPEEIKQHRPGPCTEIKLINGHYYVYVPLYAASKRKMGQKDWKKHWDHHTWYRIYPE